MWCDIWFKKANNSLNHLPVRCRSLVWWCCFLGSRMPQICLNNSLNMNIFIVTVTLYWSDDYSCLVFCHMEVIKTCYLIPNLTISLVLNVSLCRTFIHKASKEIGGETAHEDVLTVDERSMK